MGVVAKRTAKAQSTFALTQVAEANSSLVDNIVALANEAAGCTSTITFDKAASRRIPSMELIS